MKSHAITFLPEGITVQAAKGRNLLEAAKAAGITVNSVCAGDGVCGKCRVIVKSGKVNANPNMFLSRRDIQRGVALACQTFIDGDAVVEVPLESRVGGVPQLASEDAIRFGRVLDRVGEGKPFEQAGLPVSAQQDCEHECTEQGWDRYGGQKGKHHNRFRM